MWLVKRGEYPTELSNNVTGAAVKAINISRSVRLMDYITPSVGPAGSPSNNYCGTNQQSLTNIILQPRKLCLWLLPAANWHRYRRTACCYNFSYTQLSVNINLTSLNAITLSSKSVIISTRLRSDKNGLWLQTDLRILKDKLSSFKINFRY